MINDSAFSVLNAIYLKKMGSNETIAEVSGLSVGEVEEWTQKFVTEGMLLEMPTGVLLMPAGTEAVLEYYRESYRDLRELPNMERWYERFEAVNARFIALVSEWQGAADERVQERVFQQVARLTKLLDELIDRVPRYTGYVRRFEHGMSRVDKGDKQYVCNPTIDSVHNIWFEFHEDILAVLGRPRDTT